MTTVYELTLTVRNHGDGSLAYSKSYVVSTETTARSLLKEWGYAMQASVPDIECRMLDSDYISFSGPCVDGSIGIFKIQLLEPGDYLVKVPDHHWVSLQCFNTQEDAEHYLNRILKQPQL